MTAVVPNLIQEVKEGTLRLRADGVYKLRPRYNFSFSVGEFPIGLYAVQSDGPGRIALLRRHDQDRETRDPFSGLLVVNRGRELGRIRSDEPLFLVEYGPAFEVSDRMAFKAREVENYPDAEVSGTPADWKFEAAVLSKLEILG